MVACVLLSSGCSGDKREVDHLTLYVASSLTDVIQEIGILYGQSHDVEITYSFAGSGALAQQLIASPRADLFLSASQKWMDAVHDAGRIEKANTRTLLSNQLVVIGNRASTLTLSDSIHLASIPCSFFAIGDPDSVPAGRYAKEWLSGLKLPTGESVWERVESKISLAPDVRAALMQVESGADVMGIVYETDYQMYRERLVRLYKVPVESGPKIEYVVGVLNHSPAPKVAADYMAFLCGPIAAKRFEAYGFTPLADVMK
jgi:molybdate transport system substrate-binding protein